MEAQCLRCQSHNLSQEDHNAETVAVPLVYAFAKRVHKVQSGRDSVICAISVVEESNGNIECVSIYVYKCVASNFDHVSKC